MIEVLDFEFISVDLFFDKESKYGNGFYSKGQTYENFQNLCLTER